MRRVTALLALLVLPALALPAATSEEVPYAAVFFRPGFPDFGPAKRLPLRDPQTATIPRTTGSDSFEVIWGKAATGSESLWLLRRLPGGGGELQGASGRADAFGTVTAKISLALQSGSDARATLELRLLPAHHALLYRWPGAGTAAGGVPTAGRASVVAGQALPGFTVTGLDRRPQDFSRRPGTVVVFNSWATWCAPCVEELPGLNELAAKWSPRGVRFVAIARDDVGRLTSFLRDHPFAYSQTLATESSQTVFGESYPRHVIVGPDGVVLKDVLGGSLEIYRRLDTVLNDSVRP